MIEECNFKSKIRHPEAAGCNLTPNNIVCHGEEMPEKKVEENEEKSYLITNSD